MFILATGIAFVGQDFKVCSNKVDCIGLEMKWFISLPVFKPNTSEPHAPGYRLQYLLYHHQGTKYSHSLCPEDDS